MNSIRSWLGMLVLIGYSFTFIGCECDDDDDHYIPTTTTTTQPSSSHHHDDSSSGGGNNGGTTPPTPPPSSSHTVRVSNSSSYTVAVTVDGNTQNISSGASFTWTYTSSSFDITYDTLGGYSVPDTVTGGKNWSYTISNSGGVPGTVEMNGSGS